MVTNCNHLKMKYPKEGKRYVTDVANIEQLLQIIQSVSSKKAELFKTWSNLRSDLIVLERRTSKRRRWRFRLKQRKLNYRFHNPNSAEDTAEFLCKLLIEANAGKVERALQEAALGCKEEDVHIEEPVRMDMVEEPVSIRRRAR